MRLEDIPLFGMLKGRLQHLNARQRVIAENVANADTPGFVPRDVRPFDPAVRRAPGAGLSVTAPGHVGGGQGLSVSSGQHMAMADAPGQPQFAARRAPDSETTLDGNAVVLEEQMLKMAESRMNYDAAISLYQKSLNMLRLASRAPGR